MLALTIPILLFAPLALVSCQPAGDQHKADVSAARAGGGPVDVSTVPVDESVATPSNQLRAGDQAPAGAQANASTASPKGR